MEGNNAFSLKPWLGSLENLYGGGATDAQSFRLDDAEEEGLYYKNQAQGQRTNSEEGTRLTR
jgi:hypothetical protein